MVITAKFASVCDRCHRQIASGEKINWERGVRSVTHAACPDEPATAAALAAPSETARKLVARFASRCPRCQGSIHEGDEVFYIRGEKAWHVACSEQVVIDEIAALEAALNAARSAALATTPKGIYRVSFTGIEKQYGVDHVNIQLIPSAKHGSVKLSEWNGTDVGFIDANGAIRFWSQSEWRDAVDPASPRVQLVLAALTVLLGAADPIEYAKAYAVASETCWRCGADLVDEKSRERLMGPTCWARQNKGE